MGKKAPPIRSHMGSFCSRCLQPVFSSGWLIKTGNGKINTLGQYQPQFLRTASVGQEKEKSACPSASAPPFPWLLRSLLSHTVLIVFDTLITGESHHLSCFWAYFAWRNDKKSHWEILRTQGTPKSHNSTAILYHLAAHFSSAHLNVPLFLKRESLKYKHLF